MTTKHTPGPWSVGAVNYKKRNIEIKQLGYAQINRVTITYRDDELPEDLLNRIMLANARLISAAPEMLEALKAVRAWDVSNLAFDAPLAIRQQIQSAIIKAEGEES